MRSERIKSRVFVSSLVLFSLVAVTCADDLLYTYDAGVPPFDESAGWRVFDSCDPTKDCERSVENGHYVLRWRGGGDIVNYDLIIPHPLDTLWVEWRFRSNWPFPPPEPGCDGRFVVGDPVDLIFLHGNLVVMGGGDAFLGNLELNEFHTYRFERVRGDHYQLSVNGQIFQLKADDARSIIFFLQFQGMGTCNRKIGVEVPENAWDFIRYGTISNGELIAASDPPVGIIDANAFPNLDRFTITFDQPGYVYIDQIAVSVTGGVAPVVTQTRRLDNGPTDVVEIVLDRAIPLGETTTFKFDDGVATNVVIYTYLSLGACCFDDGTCVEAEESECESGGGAFTPGALCEPARGCCFSYGTCLDLAPACCQLSSDIPQPADSTCEGDLDGDNLDAACGDDCPSDPFKTEPGQCGCRVPDMDSDGDTVPNCLDQCDGQDDTRDFDNNNIPDCLEFFPIPTVSTWGLVVLTLLLAIGAKLAFRRRAVTAFFSLL